MKDRATQLLIKYKSGALVTQKYIKRYPGLPEDKSEDDNWVSPPFDGQVTHETKEDTSNHLGYNQQ